VSVWVTSFEDPLGECAVWQTPVHTNAAVRMKAMERTAARGPFKNLILTLLIVLLLLFKCYKSEKMDLCMGTHGLGKVGSPGTYFII
jgi:hypothetical protein